MTLKEAVEVELVRALKGCSGCDYDEAEGGLVDHCDKCCRKVTTLAWRWANTLRRKTTPGVCVDKGPKT